MEKFSYHLPCNPKKKYVLKRGKNHLDVRWKEATSWKSLSQRKMRQWLDRSMLSDSSDERTKVFTLKLFQVFCQLDNNFLKKKTNNAFETWKPSKWKKNLNKHSLYYLGKIKKIKLLFQADITDKLHNASRYL